MTKTITRDELIARWNTDEGKPYKGKLIDMAASGSDGDSPPTDIGCMCAQGQALHLLGGWSPRQLADARQTEADRATAELLGISRAHAVLLRSINDSRDGAPAIVLTNPELVLGDQAHVVLAFWRHLDRMTKKQWDAAWDVARDAAWDVARDVARDAAGDVAWDAAGDVAGAAARDAAGDVAWDAAGDVAGAAARDVAWAAARAAAWAANEIQGARILREQGRSFYFLPMFGFADPEAVLAADAEAR